MSDDKVSKDESYSFFSNFSYCEDMEDKLLNVGVNEKNCCDSFLKDSIFIHIPFPDIFCEQFNKLHNLLLKSTVGKKKSDTLENSDCAFMNYWINDKLRGINSDNSISVNDFYKKLKTNNATIFKNEKLEKKLYNIEKQDLENMRVLYNLYNIKSKVSTALAVDASPDVSASCLMYTNKCKKKYRDSIINCNDDCSDFYSALTDFKNKYKKDLSLNHDNSSSCKSEELFLLPHYEAVLKEHESIQIIKNTTLSVLLPVFGVFIMLIFSDTITPFSKSVLEKIKRTKYMLCAERERCNELLSYTSDDDSCVFNEGEYNISYYTVRNS
ncbi:PIR Superfamily Protein [Plasmodium ovale curtisi]|uniref:PIR Superfamily Protein n=1 Tax=Plasmodium ovale curtisi TaxID=864141 RepID=A0A1A8WMK0_PLAOA|nr:PIR Superfamily Protein [Plasmodium ovale curtisi]